MIVRKCEWTNCKTEAERCDNAVRSSSDLYVLRQMWFFEEDLVFFLCQGTKVRYSKTLGVNSSASIKNVGFFMDPPGSVLLNLSKHAYRSALDLQTGFL